ncbi:homocysteine S-methyltransferase family protein [Actinomadura miaoliensis]|uniref:Homocysteine S-methyltransferase family protein n=1 Tax=Actinomadura miaoliensis TaxID=430685 RepID=A0ABP7VQ11_9ACTN
MTVRPTTGEPVRLDGATATELQRAGLPVRAPWWSTLALNGEGHRRLLREVHERHIAAGAQVITANTFRCNPRALRRLGLDSAGLGWMVHAAVGVARAARSAAKAEDVLIAGAMAPVEDCYRPDLVPPDEELRAEHRRLAAELVGAGVDLVLVETMNRAREARVALEQVRAAGGRAWVSFVCADGARLLSGEPLADAARAVERDGAAATLVNCASLDDTETALRVLRDACDGPVGVAPNLEDRGGIPRGRHVDRVLPAAVTPERFAERVARWREESGVDIVGGCCGATPAHMAALHHAPAAPGAQ